MAASPATIAWRARMVKRTAKMESMTTRSAFKFGAKRILILHFVGCRSVGHGRILRRKNLVVVGSGGRLACVRLVQILLRHGGDEAFVDVDDLGAQTALKLLLLSGIFAARPLTVCHERLPADAFPLRIDEAVLAQRPLGRRPAKGAAATGRLPLHQHHRRHALAPSVVKIFFTFRVASAHRVHHRIVFGHFFAARPRLALRMLRRKYAHAPQSTFRRMLITSQLMLMLMVIRHIHSVHAPQFSQRIRIVFDVRARGSAKDKYKMYKMNAKRISRYTRSTIDYR